MSTRRHRGGVAKMARMLIATSVATFFLLSAPIWAQELEIYDNQSGGISAGTPVPCPDATPTTLGSIVDEAQYLVSDAMKGRVVRSDDPRLAEIERQLRLLQNPPKAPHPTRPRTRAHVSRSQPVASAPNSPPLPVNGHVGAPGHSEVEHLIVETWGVCRQLRALQGDKEDCKDELLAIQKRLTGVDKALKKFDERLTTETTKRQSDDATLAVLFLLLLGAGMFVTGIANRQGVTT